MLLNASVCVVPQHILPKAFSNTHTHTRMIILHYTLEKRIQNSYKSTTDCLQPTFTLVYNCAITVYDPQNGNKAEVCD